MRNSLTVASQDKDLSVMEVYEHTFRGSLKNGWTGGVNSAIAACPEFIVMGPVCHMVKDLTGSSFLSVLVSGLGETAITFGPQSQNSQMAFNQEVIAEGHPELQVPVMSLTPWGPGVYVHIARNMAALAGIRIFFTTSPGQFGQCRHVKGHHAHLLGRRHRLARFRMFQHAFEPAFQLRGHLHTVQGRDGQSDGLLDESFGILGQELHNSRRRWTSRVDQPNFGTRLILEMCLRSHSVHLLRGHRKTISEFFREERFQQE